MASVRLLFTPEIQQLATTAGLLSVRVDDTMIDVYSTDRTQIQSWIDANQITSPLIPHRMNTHITSYDTILTPHSSNVPYFTMSQLRAIYNFPVPSTSNYVIGVVSFGGGLYGSVDSHGVLTNGDVQSYWTSIGIASANHPKVIVVPINGATNSPNVNDGGSTMENTLDVEAIGGAFPSANLTIILYISPSTLDQFPVLLNYMEQFTSVINQYKDAYKWSHEFAPWAIESVNIQHYMPGQGFHKWHTERIGKQYPDAARHLVWMTYLNDVNSGGETEFYYQQLKVKPRKGLTLMWPADWTHTHRGLVADTEEKYIITGWISYI